MKGYKQVATHEVARTWGSIPGHTARVELCIADAMQKTGKKGRRKHKKY
jgi:hypothetical protein